MQTGFRQMPTDLGFARRSARYLAAQGYPPRAIRSALVDELDVSASDAETVLSAVAA